MTTKDITVHSCPDCNAHWAITTDESIIMLPSNRLPYIKSSKGNVHYLTPEELVKIIVMSFGKFIYNE